MKIRFPLVALFICILSFGCSDENKTESTVSAIQKLCECENGQGKTMDAMSKELLGSDIYSNSPNAESFSDAINKLDPSVRDAWFDAISKNFFADDKYMKCAKKNLPAVKQHFENIFKMGEEEKVLATAFLGQPQYYTIYRVLPSIISAVEESESK